MPTPYKFLKVSLPIIAAFSATMAIAAGPQEPNQADLIKVVAGDSCSGDNGGLGACVISNADLAGVSLHAVNLMDIVANNTNFDSADINSVNFEGANLDGANFSNSQIFGASFKDTYLHETNFTNTHFSDVNFDYANASLANFTGATFGIGGLAAFTNNPLIRFCYTIMPDGTRNDRNCSFEWQPSLNINSEKK